MLIADLLQPQILIFAPLIVFAAYVVFGVTGFGFFQQRQYQQFSITSSAPLLEVKPLPIAPAGFNGAVGDLKLASKIVPLTAAVGERAVAKGALTTVYAWREAQGPMSAALVPLDIKTALQKHFGV